jgi:hypothetical protein
VVQGVMRKQASVRGLGRVGRTCFEFGQGPGVVTQPL